MDVKTIQLIEETANREIPIKHDSIPDIALPFFMAGIELGKKRLAVEIIELENELRFGDKK